MRHVQRSGNQGRTRTVAGSLALVSGLALFGVARAPLAVGQLASVNVGNGGGASAGTGGNSATGNASDNTLGSTSTSGGLLGGLVDANVGLGAPKNDSTGTATVQSGPATASGNAAETGINQASSSGGSSSSFSPGNPFGGGSGFNQSATVTNNGASTADTGGNTAVGNNSVNTIGSTQGVGLVDADVTTAGATNTSNGTATVFTGPATASGNAASTSVNQARITDTGSGGGFGSGAGGGFGSGAGGGAGFFNATPFLPGAFPGTVSGFGSSFDPCSGRFFPFSPFLNDPSGQRASIDNEGVASASTGDNTAVGNNSTNEATVNQTASGGLVGLNVNLGSPTNTSTGTATVQSGAATASGNQSVDEVNQFCGPVGGGGGGNQPFNRNVITGGPIVVPAIATTPLVVNPSVTTLARTGFESGMIVTAVALVLFGMAMLMTARRRLAPAARSGSVSTSEWDSIVRW